MKDMRARQIIVVEDKHMDDELVKGYMHEGYGIIEIPDLSKVAKSSSDFLLTVMTDEIQEFLRDGEQVIFIQDKKDVWSRSLLSKLSKRKVSVQVREF